MQEKVGNYAVILRGFKQGKPYDEVRYFSTREEADFLIGDIGRNLFYDYDADGNPWNRATTAQIVDVFENAD